MNGPNKHEGRLRQAIQLALLVFGLGLLFALVQRIGWVRTVRVLQSADLRLVLLGCLLYLVGQFSRALRWALWIRWVEERAPLWEVLSAYAAKAFLGDLTPMRAGDVSGPFFLRAKCGIDLGRAVAVVLVDQVLDGFVFGALYLGFCLFLVFGYDLAPWIDSLLATTGGILLGAWLMALTAWVLHRKRPLMATRWGWVARIGAAITRFQREVGGLATLPRVAWGTALCALGWAIDLTAVFLFVRAVVSVRWLDWGALQVVGAGASLVSLVPSGLGVNSLTQGALASALGYPFERVVGATIMTAALVHGLRAALLLITASWRGGKSQLGALSLLVLSGGALVAAIP